MVLAAMIVLGGFGLLYLAVSNEERGLEKSSRSGKH